MPVGVHFQIVRSVPNTITTSVMQNIESCIREA